MTWHGTKKNSGQENVVDAVIVSTTYWIKLMRQEEMKTTGTNIMPFRKELPQVAHDSVPVWDLFESEDLGINLARRSGITSDLHGEFGHSHRTPLEFSNATMQKEMRETRERDTKEINIYINIFNDGKSLEFLASRRRANILTRTFGVDIVKVRNGFERDELSHAVMDTQRNRSAASEAMTALISTLIQRHTSFYARI